jgi:hypothetical protein
MAVVEQRCDLAAEVAANTSSAAICATLEQVTLCPCLVLRHAFCKEFSPFPTLFRLIMCIYGVVMFYGLLGMLLQRLVRPAALSFGVCAASPKQQHGLKILRKCRLWACFEYHLGWGLQLSQRNASLHLAACPSVWSCVQPEPTVHIHLPAQQAHDAGLIFFGSPTLMKVLLVGIPAGTARMDARVAIFQQARSLRSRSLLRRPLHLCSPAAFQKILHPKCSPLPNCHFSNSLSFGRACHPQRRRTFREPLSRLVHGSHAPLTAAAHVCPLAWAEERAPLDGARARPCRSRFCWQCLSRCGRVTCAVAAAGRRHTVCCTRFGCPYIATPERNGGR